MPLDSDEKEIDFVQLQRKPFVLATPNDPHDTELRFIEAAGCRSSQVPLG